MKYIILHADGMADVLRHDAGGKATVMPNIARLAQGGEFGMFNVQADGLPAGSDLTELAVLGYDPRKYYSGPGPLEAASLGVSVGEHDVVFRCTMVTLRADGAPGGRSAPGEVKKLGPQVVMEDATAGLIDTEQARELIDAINEQLGSETIQFYPGSGHRNLMVWVNGKARARCSDPRGLVGRSIGDALPSGDGADILKKLMEASLVILRDHPINDERREAGHNPANCLWLWGQGRAPVWPSLTERYQVSGGIVTSSDLHRGIGMCVGLDAVEPSSLREADGPEFISYGEAALQELGKKDLVYVHAAMPDDALHASEPKAKADITDAFDQQVVGRILDRVSQLGPSRILLVCDPPRSAGKEPSGHVYIPYAFGEWPATQRIGGTGFNEADVKSGSVSPRDATKFLAVLLSRKA